MGEKILEDTCCAGHLEFKSSVEKNDLCPVCGKVGNAVKNITVKHMVLKELIEQVEGKDYYLCMNKECDVIYYDKELGTQFSKQQVKVPIWFKKDASPKYTCYCSKVTEDQVINAVVKDGANNMKEVLKITGAMSSPDCQKKNPLGKCCHQIVQDAIDKGLIICNK